MYVIIEHILLCYTTAISIASVPFIAQHGFAISNTQKKLFVDEDIKLNSTVFHWPEHIQTVFELSQTRILNRREHAEEETKKKVAAFEDRLNEYQKEVDSFRKKEVRECKTYRCIDSYFSYLQTNRL